MPVLERKISFKAEAWAFAVSSACPTPVCGLILHMQTDTRVLYLYAVHLYIYNGLKKKIDLFNL